MLLQYFSIIPSTRVQRTIVNAGVIPHNVDVLKNDSMEARENAATTLFSLLVLDENKVTIGAAGAIPYLIKLLCEGTPRGKKRAVKAGIVAPLIQFMNDAGRGMVDKALAIMITLQAIMKVGHQSVNALLQL
ncbi:putative aminoacyltransferase, E1 ubiquitin-activating enzyme [Medicago truncatula]|uniref:Putative aminoacyltransferase, E1 ubiquitin-activating enzyme n=1 Tax=Medicago truncatula TaxID=3880 RepID=A0A396JZU7_MEDTR|nr:putative aminoacyltransferase, E1 ubiquitin-activating enzyme [Medicago truncatula]